MKQVLTEIYTAWAKEDKDRFRTLVFDAFCKALDKQDILDYISSRQGEYSINEDFEEWAYMFIVTSGQSDCTPG